MKCSAICQPTVPFASAALLSFAFCVGCGSSQTPPSDASEPPPADETTAATPADDEGGPTLDVDTAAPAADEGPWMKVPLLAKSGSDIKGHVELLEDSEGVEVKVSIENAKPGLHGVHIHEMPDCSALDGKSAGGHFNPTEHAHGIPDKTQERHMGDLGNMTVQDDGTGTLEIKARFADLSEASDGVGFSFRDRALIVHADPDTGAQPSGNSGIRIACAELTEDAALAFEQNAPE